MSKPKTNMDCDRCNGQEICCSQRVLVTPMEARRLSLGSKEFIMNDDNSLCQFFHKGRKGCTVYSKRPMACRDFNCCNPDQVQVRGGIMSAEALQVLKSSVKPEHWLHCELERRKKRESDTITIVPKSAYKL